MFGADGGVIEAGGDRMGQFDLAFFVGQQKSFGALENAKSPTLKSSSMFSAPNSLAAGFDADHAYISILQKRVEQSDRVAAAANAGDKQIGQLLRAFEDLTARFNTDNALKIAHHHRVGMRAKDRSQYIMSGADVGDPVAHCFVDRFLKRGLTDRDWNDFRAEKFHPRDIERLSLHIDLAHVDHAFAAEPRRDCSGGDAVLTRTGFGDDAALAHSLREQNLSEGVIYFVRAGVKKIFAL